MVNRLDRNTMIGYINQMLDGQLDWLGFIKQSKRLFKDTDDRSLQMMRKEIGDGELDWEEDFAWDTWQRWLLFLHSDEELAFKRDWCWSWRPMFGLGCVLIWLTGVWQLGFVYSLLWVHVVLVLPMIGLTIWHSRECDRLWRRYGRLASVCQPFGSYGELRRVYESVGKFRKKRYVELVSDAGEKIGWFDWLMKPLRYVTITFMVFMMVMVCLLLLMFVVPIVLGFLVLPANIGRYEIVARGAWEDKAGLSSVD
ncbi:hypothetical protein [Poriferisphaera sp. WC338]|uniref:hypothetical protein n=1 Tax=Poriferisphaera sp. WC338 TaxID=3425129 RepID=UPI003D816A67